MLQVNQKVQKVCTHYLYHLTFRLKCDGISAHWIPNYKKKEVIRLTNYRPQLHHRFDPFQNLDGIHWLDYVGHTTDFPIGYIGGGPIGATEAREVINDAFGIKSGPIIHLALAPHDGSLGFGHYHVVFFDELPAEHVTIVADAVIVPKIEEFMIETLLSDCACILVADDDYLGFIHCGTPELFVQPSLLENFWPAWQGIDGKSDTTDVFMGPCITGRNYQYGPDAVPDKYKGFVIECDGHDTVWDEGHTFALAEAIHAELRKWGTRSLTNCGVDPFTENVLGRHEWASARYYKHLKDRHGQGDGLSPRDMALFRYSPVA